MTSFLLLSIRNSRKIRKNSIPQMLQSKRLLKRKNQSKNSFKKKKMISIKHNINSSLKNQTSARNSSNLFLKNEKWSRQSLARIFISISYTGKFKNLLMFKALELSHLLIKNKLHLNNSKKSNLGFLLQITFLVSGSHQRIFL